MAGLPPMEMLSTPHLVARLLQMKTQTHRHTHRQTHTHTHTLSDGPPAATALHPGAQSSNFRVQSQGRGGRAAMDGTEGKSSSHPHTLLGPEGFEQAMLFWGLGVKPEWVGTLGHPAHP